VGAGTIIFLDIEHYTYPNNPYEDKLIMQTNLNNGYISLNYIDLNNAYTYYYTYVVTFSQYYDLVINTEPLATAHIISDSSSTHSTIPLEIYLDCSTPSQTYTYQKYGFNYTDFYDIQLSTLLSKYIKVTKANDYYITEVPNFMIYDNGSVYITHIVYYDTSNYISALIPLPNPIVVEFPNFPTDYLFYDKFFLGHAYLTPASSGIVLRLYKYGSSTHKTYLLDIKPIDYILQNYEFVTVNTFINDYNNGIGNTLEIYTPTPPAPAKGKTYVLRIDFDYGLDDYFKVNEIKIYDNNADLVTTIQKDIKAFSLKCKPGYIYFADITYTILDKTYTKRVYFYLNPNKNDAILRVNHFTPLVIFDFRKQFDFLEKFNSLESSGEVWYYLANSFDVDVNSIWYSNYYHISTIISRVEHNYNIGNVTETLEYKILKEIDVNQTTPHIKVYEYYFDEITKMESVVEKSLWWYDKHNAKLYVLINSDDVENTFFNTYTIFQLRYNDKEHSAIFAVNNYYLWTTEVEPNYNITIDVYKYLVAKAEVFNYNVFYRINLLTSLNPFMLDKKVVVYDKVLDSVFIQKDKLLYLKDSLFTTAYKFENIRDDSELLVIVNENLDNNILLEVVSQSFRTDALHFINEYFYFILIGLMIIVAIVSKNIIVAIGSGGLLLLVYSVLVFNYIALIMSIIMLVVSLRGDEEWRRL